MKLCCLILCFCILMASCTSTEQNDSIKKIAIISVQIDKRIQDNGNLNSISGQYIAVNKNFDLSQYANDLEEIVHSKLLARLRLTPIDQDTLKTSSEYMRLVNDNKYWTLPIYYDVPNGYIPIKKVKEIRIKELSEIFPNIDGFMFVSIEFRTESAAVFDEHHTHKNISGVLSIQILSRNGWPLFNFEKTQYSDTSFLDNQYGQMNIMEPISATKEVVEKLYKLLYKWIEE